MNALELKNSILKLMADTDDLTVLSQVQAYFKSLKNNTDWWDEINSKEQEMIRIGRQQLAEGKGVSNEVVRTRVDQLLI